MSEDEMRREFIAWFFAEEQREARQAQLRAEPNRYAQMAAGQALDLEVFRALCERQNSGARIQ